MTSPLGVTRATINKRSGFDERTSVGKRTDSASDVAFYLDRIRQIDRIIADPVKTLIELAEDGQKEGKKIRSKAKNLIYFPTWISEEFAPREKEDSLLTRAVCCSTLQRISRLQRRFSWLDDESKQRLKNVQTGLVESFIPKKSADFNQCANLLYSETFGGLNPLTASQVFRVLLNEGENRAHSGIGFLAFFAMVWPLYREFPNRLMIGARVEPWEVTAYVTAKCLLPIGSLQTTIARRAQLFDDITKNLHALKANRSKTGERGRWLFSTELDDLSANLSRLASLAIHKEAFRNCAKAVQEQSDNVKENSDNAAVYLNVLQKLGLALIQVRERSENVLSDAETLVDSIKNQISKPLKNKDEKKLAGGNLKLKLAGEYLKNNAYWKDLATAAVKSISICQRALAVLKVAGQICPELVRRKKTKPAALEKSIMKGLKDLARANRSVSQVLSDPVKHAALWCRSVVDREIAHASAENVTDFDPCELVSAIAVAVRWNLMTTPLQVSDAVTKAIAGARSDGSWRSGKPFYSPNYAFGIWAMTSDIVWTLTSAIEKFPEVREADENLFNFVNWLERTRLTLPTSQRHVGWVSERLRDRSKIHLGTTALAINALLEIRDLTEYRLWKLCGRRFSVISIEKPLKQIDPVDLGASHSRRLHRRLSRMADQAQSNDRDADYALVLHGPPGSSKTKIAEALSAEMWKSFYGWGQKEPRLIRITPADFTRLGEDRLDSEARAIFDLIGGVRAVTIFFDEIDDLLRQRNTGQDRPRFMDLVVPAMLNRLADLRAACPRQEICFLLATNYIENIDSALIRKGRIDASIPVVYPDFKSRVAIAIDKMEKARTLKFINKSSFNRIATETGGWPYTALTSLCSFVAEKVAAASLSKGRRAFDPILKAATAEHESSFTLPAYERRWMGIKRYSQELLNEYWHHLVSREKTAERWHTLFHEQDISKDIIKWFLALDPSNTEEKLDEMLKTMLTNEGRL